MSIGIMEQDTVTQRSITKLAYSVDEVSAMTTLSPGFLRKEISKGNLLVVRPGNSRRVLILKNDLAAYLEGKTKN